MKKYLDNNLKIIEPEYLFSHFNDFSFEKVCFIILDETELEVIQKDIFKDCYLYMVDNDIELKYGEDYISYISEFESNCCYLNLDLFHLEETLDTHDFFKYLIELVSVLDVETDKFVLFKDLFDLYSFNNIIIKFNETPRNLLMSPYSDVSLEYIRRINSL